MRIAIIDLGTNTFNLFIVDLLADGKFQPVFKTRIPVKLGEKINKKLITESAYLRGMGALRSQKAIIERFNTSKIYAFATSAIRSCRNGGKFTKEAEKNLGIKINVINGEKEAELIYYGVRSAVNIGDTASLILDIGGGSNEFIIATGKDILWKKSFDLGMARLLDKFRPSEPISDSEIRQIENYLEESLESLFVAINENPVKELIGASGSFETFAQLCLVGRDNNDETLKGRTEFEFKMEEYKKVHEKLLQTTKDERLNMKGLIEMRADYIVLASLFVEFILRKAEIPRMRLSAFALKEGVLQDILKTKV